MQSELAGHTVALLCLGALSLLVVATNPFALDLPAALAARLAVAAAGARPAPPGPARRPRTRASPARPCCSARSQAALQLGWDAPWYLAELRASATCPFVVMPLLAVWLAGTAPARRTCRPPVRAVSRRVRAAAARPAPARRSHRTTLAVRESAAARESDGAPGGVGGLDARPVRLRISEPCSPSRAR